MTPPDVLLTMTMREAEKTADDVEVIKHPIHP